MEFVGNRVRVDPPKQPKRLTGTRLASVLGLDRWNTEFKTWCTITKTYEEPFVDNKYTIAGKTIEPKVIQYLKDVYLLNIITPEDAYGKNYFEKTWGNFFPEQYPFGGMWDALLVENGKTKGIIEIKTTKRAEDWEHDVPEHYAIQASLYAYLKGVDDVIMVCSFLEDKDYLGPEKFVPSSENTIMREFKVSERYDDFEDHIRQAKWWWEVYVETGLSPEFDETRDKDILSELRTNTIDSLENVEELSDLLLKIDTLYDIVKKHRAEITSEEKELKELQDQLKKYAMKRFRKNDNKVVIPSGTYDWTISKSSREKVDKKAMKKDGIFDKYVTAKDSYRLTASRKGE